MADIDLGRVVPVKGTDYFTPEEKEELLEDLAERVGSSGGGITSHGLLTGRDASGQHPISAITGLQTALDNKQPAGNYLPGNTTPAQLGAALENHSHSLSEITGLQAALDNKQPAGSYLPGNTTPEQLGAALENHTHSAEDITSGSFNTARLPTVPVSKGGTGKSTWAANRIAYPSGSDAFSQLSFPLSEGSFLRQGVSGAPYWSSPAEVAGEIGSPGGTGSGTGGTGSAVSQETGVWTPVLYGDRSGLHENPLGTFTGSYVKTGKLVHIECEINVNDIGGVLGSLFVAGLPFYVGNSALLIASYDYLNEWVTDAYAYYDVIFLRKSDISSPETREDATEYAFSSGGTVFISGNYQIAEV